jgi:glycosyltransferase involved in cell wall biosynthesis
MKIIVFDSWKKKFSEPIIKHWESLGHEVIFDPLWDRIPEADLIYFYQSDNQFVEFTTNKELQASRKAGSKLYSGVIDIEAWANQPQTADWSVVDGVTFIAEHIREMVLPHINHPRKVSLIKPGINLNKFTMKKPNPHGPPIKIAYVVGDRRIWDVKRFDIALMLLRDLLDATKYEWELHIRGTYSSHEQYNDYCNHLIENLDLEDHIVWTEMVEDMNAWLEDKDFFLLPSTKEAFSYATAEAMAKGIKPIIGNWRSADINWEPFYCKTIGQMFSSILDNNYDPKAYRKFVEDNYDEKRYFKELDTFLEIS